jgi:DnaK suppressor protein
MDDLTEDQLAELKAALESLKAELETTIMRSAEAAKPVTLDQQAIGRVSRIDAIQQQKMVEANRHRQKRRLSQTKQALDALEAGEFGDCRRCDEMIALARLMAKPESPICLDCQSALEARR